MNKPDYPHQPIATVMAPGAGTGQTQQMALDKPANSSEGFHRPWAQMQSRAVHAPVGMLN